MKVRKNKFIKDIPSLLSPFQIPTTNAPNPHLLTIPIHATPWTPTPHLILPL